MPALPWLKWYPQDWRNDPKLSLCSIGARGMLAELMGLGHESEQYGRLLVNGKEPTTAELAVLCKVTEEECGALVSELEQRGVLQRDAAKVLYIPRMVRDYEKRRQGKRTGRYGGNPALKPKPLTPRTDKGRAEGVNPSLTSDLCTLASKEAPRDPTTTEPRPRTYQDDVRELEQRRQGGTAQPEAPPWPERRPCPRPGCAEVLELRHGRNGWYYTHPHWLKHQCDFHCDAGDYDRAAAAQAPRDQYRKTQRRCPSCQEPIEHDQAECDECHTKALKEMGYVP